MEILPTSYPNFNSSRHSRKDFFPPLAFPRRRPQLLLDAREFCHNGSIRWEFAGSRRRKFRKPRLLVPLASRMGSSGNSRFGRLDFRILGGSAIAVALAVGNRVLYKLALIPMKEFPFFMAQMTTFGYVAVYLSILFVRYKVGIVSKDMLRLPKFPFMAIGLLEALGVAVGMSAGAMLPGQVIPILTQAFLVWQLIFSSIILGRRYSLNQILGCFMVAGGVIIALSSGFSDGQVHSQGVLWPALMIASTAFQAAASIIKEFVFIDAQRRLQGKPLDIFVVNSFGSGFQALFVLLLLPFLSNLKGIPFSELPAYTSRGIGCFLNLGSETGCDGAPLFPLLYMLVNMSFNISLLSLVKISSAVVSSLTVALSVPIAIYVFTLPLPHIATEASLGTLFIVGTGVLFLGLMLYNFPQPSKPTSKVK